MKKYTLASTILLFCVTKLFAQSPGGISSNLELWVKANHNTYNIGTTQATNGQTISQWEDNSPSSNDFNQVNNTQKPIFRTTGTGNVNFNPTLEFLGIGTGNETQLINYTLNLDYGVTLFGVWFFQNQATTGSMHKAILVSDDDHGGGGTSAGGYLFATGRSNSWALTCSTPGNPATGNSYSNTSHINNNYHIGELHDDLGTSTLYFDGVSQSSATHVQNSFFFTTGYEIGSHENANSSNQASRYYKGYIAEVIAFDYALSVTERQQVESYLAIKYGITITGNPCSIDYLSSAGTVIWDQSINAGYDNDIAGIALDNNSELDQPKSHSINKSGGVLNDIVTIANGTNFGTATNIATDQSFMVWGNNNAGLNFTGMAATTSVNSIVYNKLFDRQWKTEETGTVGITTLNFDLSNATGTFNWADLVLLVDVDGDFTNGSFAILPSSIDSLGTQTVNFQHDFSGTEGFYFTLASATILEIDDPLPIIACDSIILPVITGVNLTGNQAYYVATGGNGASFTTGTVYSSTTLYLYDETGGIPNVFDEDTLVITINNASNGTDVQTACESYIWIDGVNYTTSNTTAKDTIIGGGFNGCDSIVTLDLIINNIGIGIDSQTACDSYTWIDGINYASSNTTATHTILGGSVNGCDSIVTLNLTINNVGIGIDSQTACDSYTWIDGINYASSNTTATHTILGGSINGCDSIVTLDLTINNTIYSTDIRTTCGSYTWIDGVNYTTSNTTATHTILGGSINGCDSIVTLDLTIYNPVYSTDIQTDCGSYTWIDGITYTSSNTTATHTIIGGSANGCDSIVTLNLSINNTVNSTDIQTACGSYTWIDGNSYVASNNTAVYTLSNGSITGCDSIITLDLTVSPIPTVYLGNDTIICEETRILDATNPNIASYLWQDGETTPTHTVLQSGVYNVTVTNNEGCSSFDQIIFTKDCPYALWVPNVFTPNGDGLNDVFLAYGEFIEDYELIIFNRWGQEIFSTKTLNNGWDGTYLGNSHPSGIYPYLIRYSYYDKRVLIQDVKKGHITLVK